MQKVRFVVVCQQQTTRAGGDEVEIVLRPIADPAIADDEKAQRNADPHGRITLFADNDDSKGLFTNGALYEVTITPIEIARGEKGGGPSKG